ncbi:hypothetical protein GC101_30635 [Paenibacillus sp. LMG 31459]|uniref:C1q domain-containing protein n=1 Tax=Paenibacillus phytohabitans TaxID=2654978 RepID=A0ABX1YRK1_9BACL|nr:hypothetical protein [Paenibacillus phytohabitans]
MAVFGGMTLTNKGLALQGKAQAGTQLNYTRIAIGDGSLSGQSVPALNALISLKKSLPIARLQMQPPNKVIIGTTLSNADITTGFYFREVGVFAQDPDGGEILYAYANAGVTADYIAPGGGTDIIEKAFDCVVVVGTAANIKAMIDESLVFAKKSELDAVDAAKVDKVSGKGLSANDYTTTEKNKLSGITAGAGGAGSASDTVIGNRTISDTIAPTGDTGTITTLLGWLANMIKSITGKSSWRTAPATTLEAAKAHADDATRHLTAAERTAWNAKETPAGAQDKADAAKTAAAADATTKAAAAQAAAATDATGKANAVQANLTAHIGAGGTAHAVATTTLAGFQSAADKAKLDGVAVGANNYTHPATHPPGIIVQDASNRFVTDTEKSTWNAKASTAVATTTTAGLESAADKAKLDSIAAGATVVANSASNGVITINGTNATVYTHPNHIGDVTSTGDGVTAIAAGVIVDADVNASAAIAWTKLSKTGASLADLPTRSAADLSSGTLAAARLPAISGDITMAAGAGTATITAGAIVNADVNTAAAIDASKIGTGVVSNAEFGYLDGVTAGIQGQLNTKANLTTTPQQTTADVTYYVRTDGNDSNDGLANTAGGAFKTIQKAIDSLPKAINHDVNINVAMGTYAESIVIKGFFGKGSFAITGTATVNIVKALGASNTLPVTLTALTSTTNNANSFEFSYCSWTYFNTCSATAADTSNAGFVIYGGSAVLASCVISNKWAALISRSAANVYMTWCTGSANSNAYYAMESSKIGGDGNTLSGVSFTSNGSNISMGAGVINPWGDNTQFSRAAVWASANADQALTAGAYTSIKYAGVSTNQLNGYNGTTGVFTSPQTGWYKVKASGLVAYVPATIQCQLRVLQNGSAGYTMDVKNAGSTSMHIMLSGDIQLYLPAGDYFAIQVHTTNALTLTGGNDITRLEVIRVA